MRHALLSVSVYNTSTGRALYSHESNRSVTPASIQKLLTTGAAFSQLGPNFRFTTSLAMRGDIDRDGVLHGNIYIIGGGDPLLGSYRYRQTSIDTLYGSWMDAIKKKGVKRVEGRVCYNISIFDDQPLHDSWQWGDVGNYYGAGVCGLNFHENMYFVHFNAGRKQGHPASVTRTVPKNIDIHGINEVTTGPEESGDQVVIYGSPTSKERLYRGTVPLGARDFAVRGAMPTPPKNCADLFASYLRSHGMSISMGSMQIYSQPDSLRPVLDYSSPSLYTIAQYTNLTSNNIYAESIFKMLGYKKYGLGSFDNGAKAVSDFVGSLGLSMEGIRIIDGSGLSRLNRTTTDFLSHYLAALTRQSYFDHFKHTLAVAGENGTAKNMLPSLPRDIRVYVKTGSMDGVRSYAGYIETRSGELLSFAISATGYDGNPRIVNEKLNKILLKIATSY